jgi:aminoglycoside phosphotransferase (APT) family kinase protein
MNHHLETMTLEASGASRILCSEVVQSLWSGYGQILRCHLEGAAQASVIVKHVHWPTRQDHPRGWNSDRSHERKVRSYGVETAWYERYAPRCTASCRVPRALALQSQGDEVFMVLEDLNASGFDRRCHQAGDVEIEACVSWLAHFHATFLHEKADGLWPTGTYWHLDTRPDEFEVLEEGPLKAAAGAIDRKLNESPYQTFVHGDAKLANFCFSPDGSAVAAVDFQYVGGGCGMKDLAYFISSCLDEEQSEEREEALLAFYFKTLETALRTSKPGLDFQALEADWRSLYPVAWTDFYRFLKGWSPGHWKLNRYSERLAREVVGTL